MLVDFQYDLCWTTLYHDPQYTPSCIMIVSNPNYTCHASMIYLSLGYQARNYALKHRDWSCSNLDIWIKCSSLMKYFGGMQ